ncbi:hypothetical protein D9M68_684350 [compost metagenome]
MAPETPMAAVSPNSSVLRFRLPASEEMNRLVRTAKAPEMAMPWPARPSVTLRSSAMGVSRLTGRNSDATSAKAHIEMARTPLQELDCSGISLAVLIVLAVMQNLGF